jgi:hypothetical protein
MLIMHCLFTSVLLFLIIKRNAYMFIRLNWKLNGIQMWIFIYVSTCVCVYIGIYVYINIHVHIFMYLKLYRSVHINVDLYACEDILVHHYE